MTSIPLFLGLKAAGLFRVTVEQETTGLDIKFTPESPSMATKGSALFTPAEGTPQKVKPAQVVDDSSDV